MACGTCLVMTVYIPSLVRTAVSLCWVTRRRLCRLAVLCRLVSLLLNTCRARVRALRPRRTVCMIWKTMFILALRSRRRPTSLMLARLRRTLISLRSVLFVTLIRAVWLSIFMRRRFWRVRMLLLSIEMGHKPKRSFGGSSPLHTWIPSVTGTDGSPDSSGDPRSGRGYWNSSDVGNSS